LIQLIFELPDFCKRVFESSPRLKLLGNVHVSADKLTQLTSCVDDRVSDDMNMTYAAVIPNDAVVTFKIAPFANRVVKRFQCRDAVIGMKAIQKSLKRGPRPFRVQPEDAKTLDAVIEFSGRDTACPTSRVG
jgi:hypothetical protein